MDSSALQIYDLVLDDILEGRVSQDGLLPTEVDLAARFGVSRMRAHAAVRELERHGVVRRKRGAGTFVRKRPSPSLARHLRGLSANRVHVVAGFERIPLHWTEATLRELEHLLADEGFAVSHIPIPDPLTRGSLERMLREVTGQGSSALALILPAEAAQFCQEHAALIFQYHRNVLLFDRGDTAPEGWPFHVVSLDPFSEGVAAAEHLYDKGYRRIAFWGARNARSYWARQRMMGIAMGLQRASDGALTPELWGYDGPEEAEDVCRRLIETGEPCAVAAATDETATWLIDAAAELGLRPPRDFGILGFDNNPRFRHYNLTTIAPPLEDVGRIMARALSGKLLPIEEFSSIVLRLPSRLIERDTCAAPEEAEVGAAQVSRSQLEEDG